MEVLHILWSAFIATSAMTWFSYLLATLQSNEFKEPRLINVLLDRSGILSRTISKSSFVGWIIHYLVGLILITVFDAVWIYTTIEATFWSGAVLGAIAGSLAVIGWKMMFRLSPNPPDIDFNKYYLHLVAAHVILGLTAALIHSHF